MKKTVIFYNNRLFASPRHLMNFFRKNKLHRDIDIKYLTQCMYKELSNVKGATLTYREYDMDDPTARDLYARIKSLTRSGIGYWLGMITPLDHFNSEIAPLLHKKEDPIQSAIQDAVTKGIGTEKDYEELIKKYKEKNK